MIWVAKTEGKDSWPVLFRNYIFAYKRNVAFLNSLSKIAALRFLLVSRLTHGPVIARTILSTWPLWPIVFNSCMTLWNYAKILFFHIFATYSYFSIWIHKRWGTLLLLIIQLPPCMFSVLRILQWVPVMTNVLPHELHRLVFFWIWMCFRKGALIHCIWEMLN